MENVKSMQVQLCKWLSTDPDHIIEQCEDILSKRQDRMLQQQAVPLEKITLLLKMIIDDGESKCQNFYDILLKQQAHYPDMQHFFNNKGSPRQTVLADAGSIASARQLTGIKANNLKMSVKVNGIPGVQSAQHGWTAGQPLAQCNALNNSVACADTLTDVDVGGDIDFSVEVNTVQPAQRVYPAAVPHPKKTMASTQGSSVDILVANKVKLVEWLSSDLHILQHAQADGIIDKRVYKQLMNTAQPEDACIQLIDTMTNRGEGPSSQFLELLKKKEICDTYPQLKEWNPSFALPGPPEPKSLSVPGPPEPKITNISLSVPDKRAFFTKNRGALVRNVKNVESIVDDLISGGFHAELAAKVSAENTDPERMRKILDSVTSKALAEVLFTGLLQHQNDVMMELPR